MKRRWIGVALMVWAGVASLFAYAPAAQATGESYSLISATQVTCTGGNCDGKVLTGGPTRFTFTSPAVNNGRTNCSFTYTLNVGAKHTGGGYDATASATGNPANRCAAPAMSSPVVLADATGVGPGGGNKPPAGAAGTGADTDPTTKCDAGTLTWLNCAITNSLVSIVDGIRDNILVPFLKVQPLGTQVKDSAGKSIPNPVYTIWQNFRNVASIFLILVFFIIIFGTALGLDNYSVKKILPHLVAGAILLPLSFFICAAFIDIGNVLGQGILSLADSFIPKPVIDFTNPFSIIFLTGVGGLATIALKGAVSDIGLALLITIGLSILATLFTLILRQILITTLIVLSPFIVLGYILPNTEGMSKKAVNNGIKLIIMYPLIMLLFEAGRIFALTAGAAFTGGGGTDDVAKAAVPLLSVIGLYLPLAATPWTFSWAGGAMKAGAGAVGRASGALNKRWGKNSQFDKDRQEHKAERAAASYTGRPVSWLGRKMQAKDENGQYKNARLARMNQRGAATRGGFSGAFPGMGPGKVAQRKMLGIAQKSRADEIVAATATAQLQQELDTGQYKSHEQIIEEGVQSALGDTRNKRIKELVTAGQRLRNGTGFAHDEWHALAMGNGVSIDREDGKGPDVIADKDARDEGKIAAYIARNGITRQEFESRRGTVQIGGQTYQGRDMQEAAINHVAGNLGDYDAIYEHMTNQPKDYDKQTLKAEVLNAGLQGTDATGKSRTLALGAEKAMRDAEYFQDPLKRRSNLGGRRPEQFEGFDKSEKWEYIAQLEALYDHRADPEVAKTLEKTNREVFVALDTSLREGGGKLDDRTKQFARTLKADGTGEIEDAAGRKHTIRFTPEEASALRQYFTPEGAVKLPAQEVTIRPPAP